MLLFLLNCLDIFFLIDISRARCLNQVGHLIKDLHSKISNSAKGVLRDTDNLSEEFNGACQVSFEGLLFFFEVSCSFALHQLKRDLRDGGDSFGSLDEGNGLLEESVVVVVVGENRVERFLIHLEGC